MSGPSPAERSGAGTAMATGMAAGARDRDAGVNPAVDVVGVSAGLSCQQKRWLAENADALRSSNAYVERRGLPLARFRAF
jgi:antitoxin CcdA